MKKILLLILLIASLSTYGQNVKVMSYNIRYDNPGDGVNQWPNRKNKVYDLIKKYNPDVIGIQEALFHQITDITTNLPEYTFVGVGRDDGKTKGEYSAILYKKNNFELIDQNTFWLSETPEVPGSKNWDAAITRVATWCKLKDKKTSKDFLVINTHFDHIGKEARTNSAQIIKTRAGELSQNLPVIIAGDFNCKREDPPYQVMTDSSGLKLIDPAPANAPGTFCSFTVNSMECNPIDYIFHTPEWSAKNYQVITDHDGTYYPSDHLPVMVELKKKR